ncbi:MAG: hypothetical protein HZA58_06495 [Acidimicrobiia bacterium]|nr:hypothetical protein [Acidimicrobiia bacterium]
MVHGGARFRRTACFALFVLVGACGAESPVGAEGEAACGRDVRFPRSFLQGPDQSRERFAATVLGRVLDDFFMAGPGVEENGEYRDAEGFSPVSDTVALGYRDGSPVSFFIVRDGRVAGWGGCSPLLVEGDLESARWHPHGPVDPAATILALEIEGGACAGPSGNEIITEIVRVDVTETDSTVEIIVWVRETPFVGTCAGIGMLLPVDAVLATPLGDRTLWDGGILPPMLIES